MDLHPSTLTVGDRVASSCRDGLLEAEYALFDPKDAVLSGVLGLGTRERGYETTAKRARQRLRDAGLGANLAREAFAAIPRGHVRRLARAPWILDVMGRLTACEAFEGGEFSAATHSFVGTWLDLRALAAACPLIGISQILQVLHLDLLLEEVAEDAPVRLVTSGVTADRSPGVRTWRKVRLEGAKNLPTVFRAMQPPGRVLEIQPREEARELEQLLRGLHARAAAACLDRPRLKLLASELAQSEASAVERSPKGPPALVTPRLPPQPIEAVGSSRLFEELSELAKELRGAPAPVVRELPLATTSPLSVALQKACDQAKVIDLVAEPVRPLPAPPKRVAFTVEPPASLAHPSEPWKLVSPLRDEAVETLPLPAGVTEDMLVPGGRPRDSKQARIAMTRLARTVGRDYRLWYGSALHAGITALETTQRHLQHTFGEAGQAASNAPAVASECARHGALLSEILARSLGAEWVDVSSEQPQDWAMELPSAVRVCPIGRVQRYVQEGRRADDLIAFYLDLEARQQHDVAIV